jgi:hypothetical protein
MTNLRLSHPTLGIALCALSFAAQSLMAADIYVSPTGSTSGTGGLNSPLDLATALSGSKVAKGGTIWLRGGTYLGPFVSHLTGDSSSPITVRGYPNERAILATDYQYLDMGVLNVLGAFAVYRDFEVTVRNPTRSYSTSFRPMGVQVQAPNTKFINLVVHDVGMGFGFWSEAVNSELYGNLIYNCGTQNTILDKRAGHGIYLQNSTGVKLIRDNIIFNQFGWGVHGFGGSLNGIALDGNILFNNGVLSGPSVGPVNNILISGAAATNISLTSNYTYQSFDVPYHQVFADANVCLGCTQWNVSGSLNVTDNYFVGGIPSAWIVGFQQANIQRNRFVGSGGFLGMLAPSDALLQADENLYWGGGYLGSPATFQYNVENFTFTQWQQRTNAEKTSQYRTGKPSGSDVVLRGNIYDSTRSNLVIYNWAMAPAVAVSLSSVMPVGASFEIRNVQDYFGPPVLVGTYLGGSISIPMTNLPVAAPLGWTAPPPTGPGFNAFVVIRK